MVRTLELAAHWVNLMTPVEQSPVSAVTGKVSCLGSQAKLQWFLWERQCQGFQPVLQFGREGLLA